MSGATVFMESAILNVCVTRLVSYPVPLSSFCQCMFISFDFGSSIFSLLSWKRALTNIEPHWNCTIQKCLVEQLGSVVYVEMVLLRVSVTLRTILSALETEEKKQIATNSIESQVPSIICRRDWNAMNRWLVVTQNPLSSRWFVALLASSLLGWVFARWSFE